VDLKYHEKHEDLFIMKKAELFFIIPLVFFISGCNSGDEFFCRGQVIQEKTWKPGEVKITWSLYMVCAGNCKDGSFCDTIEIFYDPPLPDGTIKKVFCGCEGDKKPQTCDVVLIRRNFPQLDTFPYECVPGKDGCPFPEDRCMPNFRFVKDTIKSVITGKDSIYRERNITTCDCRNPID
jgi:hypothetical protein